NRAVPGVEDSGFYPDEENGEGPFRWTDGKARLVIPLDPKEPPQGLYVQLHRPKSTWLQITVNGRELVNEPATVPPLPWWERTLDLNGLDPADRLVVEITSNALVPAVVSPGQNEDPRTLGVKVRAIKLLRQAGGEPASPSGPSFLDVILGNRAVP